MWIRMASILCLLFLLTGCVFLEERAPPVDDLFIAEANVSGEEVNRLR